MSDRELDRAVRLARGEQGAPELGEAELIATYRRVEAAIREDDRKRGLQRRLALGAMLGAAVAAVAVGFSWIPLPESAPPDSGLVATHIIRVAGDVTLLDDKDATVPVTPKAQIARVRLRRNSGADLALQTARLAIRGPASVALHERRPRIEEGQVALQVAPRPSDDPFVVHAGSAEIVVRGTEFVVQVSRGNLERVFVEEGIVEVVMPDEDAIRLEAGDSYPTASPSDEEQTDAESPFEAPWWREAGASASMGQLEVHSDPPTASVRIGGQEVGKTPLRVRWPAGDFRLTVTRPGYPRWRKRVQVRADETTEVQARLSNERKPSGANLWAAAEADLDARRCRKLQSRVESSMLGGGDESRARATMLVAECALRTRAHKRALATYETIVERYPETESAEVAWFEIAKLLARLGRRDAALASLSGYLRKYPDGQFAGAATFRRCDLLIRTEQLASARTCLQSYRRDFPTAVHANDVTLLLATLARVDGQWARAAELYRQYLAAGPNATRREDALYQLAQCLEKGNLAGVEDAVREYLRSYPRGKHREALERLVR